jgi:hypothetical protein
MNTEVVVILLLIVVIVAVLVLKTKPRRCPSVVSVAKTNYTSYSSPEYIHDIMSQPTLASTLGIVMGMEPYSDDQDEDEKDKKGKKQKKESGGVCDTKEVTAIEQRDTPYNGNTFSGILSSFPPPKNPNKNQPPDDNFKAKNLYDAFLLYKWYAYIKDHEDEFRPPPEQEALEVGAGAAVFGIGGAVTAAVLENKPELPVKAKDQVEWMKDNVSEPLINAKKYLCMFVNKKTGKSAYETVVDKLSNIKKNTGRY